MLPPNISISDPGYRPVGGSLRLPSYTGTENQDVSGKNLRVGNNVTLRPAIPTSAHLYNLRNQTWAIPRLLWDGDDTSKYNPLSSFYQDASAFPSNADSTIPFIYPNTSSDNNKYVLRFNDKDCVANSPGTMLAPMGYFIIDALSRGASRMEVVGNIEDQYGYTEKVQGLPTDETKGGPSIVCEYAGRIFYGGFSGETTDPDNNSPKMSSYVLFSRVVRDMADLTTCYQSGDPTSLKVPDLLDDDGGFIRIESAYNICNMIVAGSSLFVIAENGIWQVNGGGRSPFKATSYVVTKLSNKGSIAPNSIILVNSSIVYWAKDGIYTISPDKFGDYLVQNISDGKIQTLYDSFGLDNTRYVKGVYDSYQRKVRWLIYSNHSTDKAVLELILDMASGAYSQFEIQKPSDNNYPRPIEGVQVVPFVVPSLITSESEVKYLCVTTLSPAVKVSFGSYKEPTHYDWKSLDGVGLDAEAYLLTGALTGGDDQRKKATPWITFHFLKTEDGFDTNGTPTNQSGCLVQAQWGWTNSASSNKWGRTFEAYRFQRHWMPSTVNDGFDNGYYIVDNKSKIRGNGKAITMLFKSEPGKHLGIYGWSMIVDADSYV